MLCMGALSSLMSCMQQTDVFLQDEPITGAAQKAGSEVIKRLWYEVSKHAIRLWLLQEEG